MSKMPRILATVGVTLLAIGAVGVAPDGMVLTITNTDASTQSKAILEGLMPAAIIAGIFVGIITAIRSDKRSLGKMLEHVAIGVIAFVVLYMLLQAIL